MRLVAATREFGEQHGKQITAALVAVIVIALGVIGVLAFRNRQQSQGQDLLAQAMVVLNTAVVPVTATTNPGDAPAAAAIGAKGTFSTEAQKLNAALPKLKVAADAYPETQAGIQARYHLAATLAALGQAEGRDHAIRRCGQTRGGRQPLRTDGAARKGRCAGAGRGGRCCHRHLERTCREEGREPARGRDPDAARSRLSGERQHRRSPQDLHRHRRQPSGFAVRGGCAERAGVAQGQRVRTRRFITSFSDSKFPTAFRCRPVSVGRATATFVRFQMLMYGASSATIF